MLKDRTKKKGPNINCSKQIHGEKKSFNRKRKEKINSKEKKKWGNTFVKKRIRRLLNLAKKKLGIIVLEKVKKKKKKK